MEFNVGDRVRYDLDGEEGQVTGEINDKTVEVRWDDGASGPIPVMFLERAEEQPNRTYYGEEFAGAVSGFADAPLTQDEIKQVSALGEQLGIETFEQNVHRHLNKIADILISKNKAYSNSALDPIRVFSKSDRMEQLRVRADDKLSRIRNGDTSEDAVTDLCGYLILMKIAEESQ